MVGLIPRLIDLLGAVATPVPGPVDAVGLRAVHPAVVAQIDASRRVRIPVHRMLIGVRAADRRPRPATVARRAQRDIRVKDVVLIQRIDPQATEPPLIATRDLIRPTADMEAVTAVIGEVKTLIRPVRGPRDDIDPVRIARRDRHPDPPQARILLQTALRAVIRRQRIHDVLQTLPRITAVPAAKQPGTDTTVDTRAVVALVVPHRRIHDPRIPRIDRDIDRARGRVQRREHQLPAPATVHRAIQTTLPGRTRNMARRRREHLLRITRIDRDPPNRRTLTQPDILPMRATVARPVHPVTEIRQATARRVSLTRTRPQRAVRILRQRPHRLRLINRPHRCPVHARVHAMPHAAARNRRIDTVGGTLIRLHINHPPAHVIRPQLLPRDPRSRGRNPSSLRLRLPDLRLAHHTRRALPEIQILVRIGPTRRDRLNLRRDHHTSHRAARRRMRRRAREREHPDSDRDHRDQRQPSLGSSVGPLPDRRQRRKLLDAFQQRCDRQRRRILRHRVRLLQQLKGVLSHRETST